jgi:glycosidase
MSSPTRPAPAWLSEAVLYQIYPQSFADSDGDGIGDLPGVTERLDHVAWLGVNTIWLNPCFTSPMRDAGYDVADYSSIDQRYGTNDDLAKLVDRARTLGIRVLLDLVAGHTSDRQPWFEKSAHDLADHRYIWAGPDTHTADALPEGFVPSPGTRPGGYLPNFFAFQPALNFGYAKQNPDEPWRQPVDADGPRANRAALREIMDHWLDLGVSGFRVDMAASLVKDDPGHTETSKLWNELSSWLQASHPEAALLSEWGDPAVSVPAGFHADFFLQFGGPTEGLPFRSLLNNRAATDSAEWNPVPCYFDAAGEGSARTFIDAYLAATATIGEAGRIALPTANHDFARPVSGTRTAQQLPAYFAFQMTFPTLPAVYYGDEIGMRYVPDLPDTEGSVLGARYNRAGSRTPMQWDQSIGAGFSTAAPSALYLPLDPDPRRPDVAAQRADPDSLLHLVQRLVRLRVDNPDLLGPHGSLDVLHDGYPLVYTRAGRYLVVVNPADRDVEHRISHTREDLSGATAVENHGVSVASTADGYRITAKAFGYAVFMLRRR